MLNNIDLQKEVIKAVKPIIDSWTDDDIYAISFFVYDDCDNPRKPTFTLGFNTESVYEAEVSSGFSSKEEARWNYAFWQQNCELVFGLGETEEIVDKWVLGVDDGGCDAITKEFVGVLVKTVKQLHESGFIRSKFGKEIPVIIHELEYYDQIAIQNIEANTLTLVQGLAGFCGYRP